MSNPAPGCFPGPYRFASINLLLAALSVVGCNSIFGIRAGVPWPGGCTDALMIDDMEDGDGKICESASSGGRKGAWFTISDGSSASLDPAPGEVVTPTRIPEDRDGSRYAAHMSGSGFTKWGALMGFNLNVENLANSPYDAGTTGGIKFSMKSNVPVTVVFRIPATIPEREGGLCADRAGEYNCDNHFDFRITAPKPGQWAEYEVPFAALAQSTKVDGDGNTVFGTATWNPALLVGINFLAPLVPFSQRALSFDVWVDDVQFYGCLGTGCIPTCADVTAPIACPATGGAAAGCWPAGTECSTVPVLQTNWHAVWGSGAGDVWAVGGSLVTERGAMMRWNGSAWAGAASAPPVWLSSIWGSGLDDVWAVGEQGIALHWNGVVWTPVPTGSNRGLTGLWGSGPNDVWAVGHRGTALHWNGVAWATVPSGTNQILVGVWGTSARDIWAVGYSETSYAGVILHSNGSGWMTVPNSVPQPLFGIWGSGPTDVWAVGFGIVHWDGVAWTPVPSGVPDQYLAGVWGSAPDDVWAVGTGGTIVHWDNSTWTAVPSGTTSDLFRLWGSGRNDVWAVGNDGTIVHFTGASWSVVPPTAIPAAQP